MEGRNPVQWPLYRHEFETVRLRLWWSVDEALPLDYSVNTYLAWADTTAPGIDGPPVPYYPAESPSQTSQWQPGPFYVEERELTLDAFSGTYFVQMAVYFWEDGVPFAAPGVDENGHLRIQRVIVKAF
jgi:hypothetical protein